MSDLVTYELHRRILIYVCKDGTVTYKPRGEKTFNGAALPVHSVATVAEADRIQNLLCRAQYESHPLLPGEIWFKLSHFNHTVEDLDRVARMMQLVDRHRDLYRCEEFWKQYRELADQDANYETQMANLRRGDR